MGHRKTWYIVIIALLILLAARMSLAPTGEPFLAEVPLSDGIHKLRLLKVTDGPHLLPADDVQS